MIDTQAIRNRILLLAFNGKLVKQDTSDAPASELVSQLSVLNGHPYKSDVTVEEIPYEIPITWEWCRLSDIGTTNIGLTYHPEDVSTQGTIVARSSNIINGRMDFSDLVRVVCPIRENHYLNNNDILICARNGSKALIGKCAIYEGESKTVAFGAFMAVYRTPLFRYVYYYFNTPVFKRNFVSDDSKQINQVTQSILKQSIIPIPPIDEQKRIVEKIEQAFSVLDTIDELQAKYADNLTALKSKLIDLAIRGNLTEQLREDGTAEELYQQIQEEKQALIKSGKIKKEKPLPEINPDEIPFEIPKSWKWVRLRDLGAFNGGKTPSMAVKEYWNNGSIPWVTSKDMKRKYVYSSEMMITELGAQEMAVFPENTVLFVVRSGILRRLLPVAILKTKGTINQDLKALSLFMPTMCEYAYYILKGFESKILFQYAKDGTTVNNIVFDALVEMPIPLPPLAEQKRIVDRLDKLLAVCD